RLDISFGIRRKNREPRLRIIIEDVDLARFGVDIHSAHHLHPGGGSPYDAFWFCEASLGRSTVAPVVLQDVKKILVRHDKHVALGIYGDSAEAGIGIFDETKWRTVDHH